MTRSRTVITGGAGFLGSHLCETLLQRGHDVVCVDDFSTGRMANIAPMLASPRFSLERFDVSTGLQIDGPVHSVLHFASPASPPHYLALPLETLKVGSLGTLHALELAEQKGARFMLASTSETYGEPLVHPQPETYWGNVNPVGPRSVYDEAKRFGEALTMAYRRTRGLDTKIVRIFNTFGERMRIDDGRAVPTFIAQALRNEPLTVAGDGSQTRSLCYVSDLIDGILRLLDCDDAGPVNIGNPHEVSMLELAELVRDLVGSSSPIRFIERPVDDPTVRRPDITLARTLLGWEPQMSVETGLCRTISWFEREMRTSESQWNFPQQRGADRTSSLVSAR